MTTPPSPPPQAAAPGLLQMAWPLVISFWLRAAFGWVDRFYAAELPDVDAAQAAIGLALPFEFLMIACWVGASTALTSKLSAAMGAGRDEEVAQLKRATMRMIFGLNVVFLGLGIWLYNGTLFASAGPEVARNFQIYAGVLLAGSSFTMFWSILPDSIVKAHQDTKTTMWSGIFSSLLNVALNTLFVFVFRWGMFGIAFSTVLARLAGLAYAQWRANALERARTARAGEPTPGQLARPLLVLLGIAIPSGLTFILTSFEAFSINLMLESGPDPKETIAAWSIFDSAVRFLAMPPIALGVALLPLAARLRGRGDFSGIRRELRTGLVAVAIYSIVFVTPLAFLAAKPLAHALLEQPGARDFAIQGLRLLPLVIPAVGVLFFARPLFDALDRPRFGLGLSALRSLVFIVPSVYAFGHFSAELGLGERGGYYAGFIIGAALGALAMLIGSRALIASSTTHATSAPEPVR